MGPEGEGEMGEGWKSGDLAPQEASRLLSHLPESHLPSLACAALPQELILA